MTDAPSTEDIAFAWAVRMTSPDFTDWDSFLAWVDGNPDRNEACNRAALVVAEVAAHVPSEAATIIPLIAEDRAPVRRRWLLGGAGLAIAASVAGVSLIGRPVDSPVWQVIETPAGQTRSIASADGSRIHLAGGSRLQLDPVRPRLAWLERGRAVFTIRHNAANPYRVMVGAHRIVDAGTTFEVSHDEHAIRVEVAEGMVIVDPAVEALRLAPGQAVELIEGRQTKRELVARESVGQWRRASLSYTDAPLTRVAADLSVALGHSIVVDAAARDRRITATITPATVKGKPDEAAELFGVRIVATSRGWIFYQR